MPTMKKCPKCGGKHIAPILYGYPVFDEELERKLDRQELVLGGCKITVCDPQFHCFDCGRDVGKPPVLFGRYGEEDYRDIVTSVKFSEGGFGCGFDEVIIEKGADRITASARAARPPFDGISELTEKQWKQLMNRLFCKLYVLDWRKSYVEPYILDGFQWELELRLTNKRVRNYYGSNMFPAYWNELRRTFRPYFLKAEEE